MTKFSLYRDAGMVSYRKSITLIIDNKKKEEKQPYSRGFRQRMKNGTRERQGRELRAT